MRKYYNRKHDVQFPLSAVHRLDCKEDFLVKVKVCSCLKGIYMF